MKYLTLSPFKWHEQLLPDCLEIKGLFNSVWRQETAGPKEVTGRM